MQIIDYVLLGVIALILAGVVVHLVKRKKQGKGGCGCGCAGCPSAGACHANAKKENVDEETV